MKQKYVILVIDAQNAFFDLFGARKALLLKKINQAILYAREKNMEVVYTKHVYSQDNPPTTISERFKKVYGSNTNLLSEESSSSEIIVDREENESVFTKATYSPFHNKMLVDKLGEGGFDAVVVCGLCLDVCVEAFIRDAYQNGLKTILLGDATDSIHYSKGEVIKFIAKLYNTEISNVEDFFGQHARVI